MKKLFIIISLFYNLSYSQSISGKVVNNLLQGLEGKKVEVHLSIDGVYTRLLDWTDNLGNFSADSVSTSDVNDEKLLPDSYSVSLNYPQPFNPKTIFNVTIPQNAIIYVDVFTILGEKVLTIDKKEFAAGTNKLIIEMNGFSNGVYIARISIDDKYLISRKLLLLYGSQHAKDFTISMSNKTQTTISLDSITISGDAIYNKSVNYGQQITLGNYDVGSIQVDSHYVNLTGRVYKLMKWKDANNGQEGAVIQIANANMITGTDGVFDLLIPSGRNNVIITHNNIYQRETKVITNNDTTINFDILDKTNFPEDLMVNLDSVTLRYWDPWGNQTFRWKNTPIFYIVADTNNFDEKTFYQQQKSYIEQHLKPGYIGPKYPEGFLKNAEIIVGTNPPDLGTEKYHIIKQDTIMPPGFIAYTGTYKDNNTGIIHSAITGYQKGLSATQMDRITIHELATGMNNMDRTNPFDNIQSVFDMGPPATSNRFTPADYKMLLFLYNRPGGVLRPDKDNGWEDWQ